MYRVERKLGNTDFRSVLRALPKGWIIEAVGYINLFQISNETTYVGVGFVKILDEKTISILVDETEPDGKLFWQAFARKYPEQNPFDIRYALLYQVGGEGELYEIDKYPSHSIGDPFSQAIHYKNVTAFVVSFLFGDWVPGRSVEVIAYQEILKNGDLGPEQPARVFRLAGIENENTM
jgi:hypothetical protein